MRIALSLLCSQSKNLVPRQKDNEILMFGLVAKTYLEQLLDPIDRPPSLIKSCFRIIEAIQYYFKEDKLVVQQACAKSWTELYASCLTGQSTENKLLIGILPLLQIVNGGGNMVEQKTATLCLCEMVEVLKSFRDLDMLRKMLGEVLRMFLRSSHDFPYLIRTVGSFAQIMDIRQHF